MVFALFAMVFTACSPVDGGAGNPSSNPDPNSGAKSDPDPTPAPDPDPDPNLPPPGPQPIAPVVGAVFMSDGTCWSLDTYSSHLEDAIPVGIVCKVCNEGEQFKGYILGLKNTNDGSGKKRWAPNSKSSIYTTKYTSYIGSPWGGDTYGGDNSVSGSAVFGYAQSYGSSEELQSTSYNSGWYVPTVYELYQYIAMNYTVLNDTLTAVGGTTLAGDYYWTSSQYDSSDVQSAYRIKPISKICEAYAKDGDCHVCVLHTF